MGKYNGEVTLEEYVRRRLVSHFTTLDKSKIVYEQEGSTESDEKQLSDDECKESKVITLTSSFNARGQKSTTTHT